MKKLFLPVLCLALLLCSCANLSASPSYKTDPAISDGSSQLTEPIESQPAISKISLSQKMDISDIDCIEPRDSNTFYIWGRKVGQDLTKDESELVLAVCNIETASINVLYRGRYRTNNADNRSVYQDEDGIDTVFSGQKIFTVDDGKLLSVSHLEEKCQREASINLKHKQMVYVDSKTLNVHFFDMITGENTLIYEAETFTSMEESRATLYPCNVRLNGDGSKILYQVARGSERVHEQLMTTSISGEIISETDLQQVQSPYLYQLWYNDGFITIESTHQSEHPPYGATLFTQYDTTGENIGSLSVECMITAMQPKFYENNQWLAFESQIGETNILSLYNAEEEKVYNVHKSKDYFVSPTVTPDGKRVVWAQDDLLYYADLVVDGAETMPVLSPPTALPSTESSSSKPAKDIPPPALVDEMTVAILTPDGKPVPNIGIYANPKSNSPLYKSADYAVSSQDGIAVLQRIRKTFAQDETIEIALCDRNQSDHTMQQTSITIPVDSTEIVKLVWNGKMPTQYEAENNNRLTIQLLTADDSPIVDAWFSISNRNNREEKSDIQNTEIIPEGVDLSMLDYDRSTDKDGKVVFTNLPKGEYSISVYVGTPPFSNVASTHPLLQQKFKMQRYIVQHSEEDNSTQKLIFTE